MTAVPSTANTIFCPLPPVIGYVAFLFSTFIVATDGSSVLLFSLIIKYPLDFKLSISSKELSAVKLSLLIGFILVTPSLTVTVHSCSVLMYPDLALVSLRV